MYGGLPHAFISGLFTTFLLNMIPIHLIAMYEALALLRRNSHAIDLNWIGYSPIRKTYIGHIYYWQQKQKELELIKNSTDKTNIMVGQAILM